MTPQSQQYNLDQEENRQTARVLSTLIWATWVAYLFLILTNLYYKDWQLIAVTLAGSALLIVPWVLLRRGHFRTSSFLFMLSALLTVTILASVGQGIRDLGIVAFPIIFIFAGLTLDSRLFRVCVGLALVAVSWLVLGETFGWFVTKPFDGEMSNWFLLLWAIIIFLIAALAVDQLSKNMRRSLELARQEISERKRAEVEVKNSEKRFHALIEHGRDNISLLAADGTLMWESPSAVSTLGYTPNQFAGHNIFELIHPDDQAWTGSMYAQVLQSPGNIQEGEFRLLHAGGTWRWIECSATNLLEEPGVQAVVLNYRDISERTQMENLISARLELMQYSQTHSLADVLQKTLNQVGELNNSPIGFYHFVESDQQTLSLQAWSTRTLKEFCQAQGGGLHYPIDQAGVWADCARNKQPIIHNDYASLPHRHGMPDGHARIVRELVVPILRGEKVVAILGVGNKPNDYTERDVELVAYFADVAWEIAERKRAEEALRISELDLKEAQSIAHIGSWKWDVIRGEVTWSDEMFRIFGIDKNSFTGRLGDAAQKAMHPDDLYIVMPGNAANIANVPFEYRIIRPDGAIRLIWAKAGNTIFDQNGKPTFLFGVAQDITESRLTEEQLRYQSTHDALTGLYNRNFFEVELARLEPSRDFPISLIVADVDGLKFMNDTRGHALGDQLLRHAANVLSSVFRDGDILARIGGDEFAVLLPATQAITAENMLARVRERLLQQNSEHTDLPVKLSLGMATAEKSGLVTAFTLADQRMYADKAARKASRNPIRAE
jgi:diguanylate cyclase (GGDEF)-like protein/PAS domain S-box-containing protein